MVAFENYNAILLDAVECLEQSRLGKLVDRIGKETSFKVETCVRGLEKAADIDEALRSTGRAMHKRRIKGEDLPLAFDYAVEINFELGDSKTSKHHGWNLNGATNLVINPDNILPEHYSKHIVTSRRGFSMLLPINNAGQIDVNNDANNIVYVHHTCAKKRDAKYLAPHVAKSMANIFYDVSSPRPNADLIDDLRQHLELLPSIGEQSMAASNGIQAAMIRVLD